MSDTSSRWRSTTDEGHLIYGEFELTQIDDDKFNLEFIISTNDGLFITNPAVPVPIR
ncbi:MAG: hypothetical protein R3F50_02370 [Gammaproteobacteria bacterium]